MMKTASSYPMIAPPPTHQGDGLRLSELTESMGVCAFTDPGPDPTYDPDPIPVEEVWGLTRR